MATNEPFDRQMHFVALAFCISLPCLLVACHDNRRESFYPSVVDAKRDGAIDRGWIPGFLPSSSRKIYELHDISPSTTWGAFEFVPADSQVFRKNLNKNVEVLPPSVSHVPNPGKTWWPKMLRGDLDVQKLHAEGIDLYVLVSPETAYTNEVLLFAIDWANGRAFFYRTATDSSIKQIPTQE